MDLLGYGYRIVENKMQEVPLMTYEADLEVPTKAGTTRHRKVKGNMLFSFCPFCGVNLKQDMAKTEEALL